MTESQTHVGEPARAVVVNVNDNEAARFMTTLMLRRAGFTVLEASDGAGALAQAAQHPDVLVLDIRLPDMDGFEVCRRIKEDEETRGIKVLLTSATFVTIDSKVQGLELGADGYLTQPYEPEELAATVQSLVRLRRAEQKLVLRARELREADRRKDEFLAMLAHELRNPLAAIGAALPVLHRKVADGGEHALEVVERQAAHLGRLVDELLDVARVTSGKIEMRKELVDINAVLARVVSSFQERGPKLRAQRLTLVSPVNHVWVEGDVTRLEQVLSNLLDNASKYTDTGGAIHVELEAVEPAGDGAAASRDDRPGSAPCVRIVVRDNGIGISPAALPEIFGLFAQADAPIDRSRGGLGIGLTLVQKLVELHGGSVQARSQGLGQGSEFEVLLPRAPASALERLPRRNGRPAASGPAASRRVLIVEDNPDVGRTLLDLCKMWGHDGDLRSDGVSGAQAILELRPDVALVDIGLPGIDGYEVARRVREDPRGRGLFLVALTGYGSAEQRKQALASGFDVHLVKPVNIDKLERLLGSARGNDHNPSAAEHRV